MSRKTTTHNKDLLLAKAILLLLIALKLVAFIQIHWIWILTPLWLPFVLAAVFCAVILLLLIAKFLFKF